MRLIDADALKEYIYGMTDVFDDWDIDEQPTIDPFEHGQWCEYERANGMYCSICRYKVKESEANRRRRWDRMKREYVELPAPFQYCPHCGAKMDEVIE